MPGVHVRGVPAETLRALLRSARAHHRSLQGEIRAILDAAARAAPPEHAYPPIRLKHVEVGSGVPWSREGVYGDEGR